MEETAAEEKSPTAAYAFPVPIPMEVLRQMERSQHYRPMFLRSKRNSNPRKKLSRNVATSVWKYTKTKPSLRLRSVRFMMIPEVH